LNAEYLPASKKRLLLAVYLDLVLFSAVLGLLLHYIAPGQEHTLLKYAAFCGLEGVLLGLVKWSPGEYMLSIRQVRRQNDPIQPEGRSTGQFMVDRRVWTSATFWTALVGVYLIVEGGKELVRWTMWTPPQPWFGMTLAPGWAPTVAIAQGLLSLLLGALVLRLHFAAPLAVVATSVFYMTAVCWSWHLWPEFAREAVTRRRAFQGLPVRGGEVELA